jgi:hypothetical protein
MEYLYLFLKITIAVSLIKSIFKIKMKATDTFKETIKNYLANLSQSDELIAKR